MAQLQSPFSVVQVHNVRVSVSCQAINLNTISSILEYNAKMSIRCALLNTGDVYVEHATLAPRHALIFRRCIAYNAGYCCSLYFQRLRIARRELLRAKREKTENSMLRTIRTLYYMQHPRHCACTCV